MITTAQLENSINKIVYTVANEYPGIERCWLKYCTEALLMYKILSAKISRDLPNKETASPNSKSISAMTIRHGFYIPETELYDVVLCKASMLTVHRDKLLNTLNKILPAIEKTASPNSKPVISAGLRKFMPRFGKMTAVKKIKSDFQIA